MKSKKILHTSAYSMFFVTRCPTHVSCGSVFPCLTLLLICCRSLSCCPSCPLPDSAPAGHFLTLSLHNWTVFLYSFCVMWSCFHFFCICFFFGIFKGYLDIYEGLLPPCLISYSSGSIVIGPIGNGPWKSPALLELSSLQDSFPEEPSKQTPMQARRQKITGVVCLMASRVTTLYSFSENLAFPAHQLIYSTKHSWLLVKRGCKIS